MKINYKVNVILNNVLLNLFHQHFYSFYQNHLIYIYIFFNFFNIIIIFSFFTNPLMKKLVSINELIIAYLKILFINESSRVLMINSWKHRNLFKKKFNFNVNQLKNKSWFNIIFIYKLNNFFNYFNFLHEELIIKILIQKIHMLV